MNRRSNKKTAKNIDFANSRFINDADFLKIKELVNGIKARYNISSSEILNSIDKKDVLIPCEIFNEKISGLETICKYLKENLNLTNKEIASLLNRDERTIWQAYDSAKKKLQEKFKIEFSKYYIPVSVFTDRNYSVLESIVKYLKENYNLSYHEIAVILKRNDRTVWTVYQRSKKKNSLRGSNVK